MTRITKKTAVTSGGLQELPTPTKESARSLASYPANRGTGKVRPVGYTRIEVHGQPDDRGRVSHTRYWTTDYKPGHPDGEYVCREVGQAFFAPLPAGAGAS